MIRIMHMLTLGLAAGEGSKEFAAEDCDCKDQDKT